MKVIFRGFNVRQATLDGDTLIIEADKLPRGVFPVSIVEWTTRRLT